MSVLKRFDRTLHEQNDKITRSAVKKLLVGSKYEILDNSKVRGVDLLVMKKDKHILNIECERKLVWTGDKFPYESINFPVRKLKYAKLDKPTIFVMFNKDLTSYCAITGDDLVKAPVNEVHNKYVRAGEMFFQVDLDNAVFNDINKVIKKLEEKNG